MTLLLLSVCEASASVPAYNIFPALINVVPKKMETIRFRAEKACERERTGKMPVLLWTLNEHPPFLAQCVTYQLYQYISSCFVHIMI